ncbi:MAG: hypothetical protein COB37_11400 [Kordiimonadales bacterium]|nr:MAG: hypothetical protein COB37_11400 [Kordiimonadales bacterium]
MTSELFPLLAQATAAVSAAILLVLIMRAKLRSIFDARVAYGFWLIVPIALFASLIPLQSTTPVPLAPQAENSTQAPLTTRASGSLDSTAITTQRLKNQQLINQRLINQRQATQQDASSGIAMGKSSAQLYVTLWALGFLASFVALIYQQIRFAGKYKLRPLHSDVKIAEHKHIGPAVVGMFKPTIIVPTDFEQRFNPLEQALILAHERAHISAGDIQINAFAAIFGCLNWFNPLVYIGLKHFRIDQELACDERVMRQHGAHRKVYANTLLKSQLSTQSPPLSCAWIPSKSHPLKQRISGLAGPVRSVTRRRVGTAILLATVGLSGAAAWSGVSSNPIYVSNIQLSEEDLLADAQGSALVNALLARRYGHARALIKAGANVSYYLRGDGTPLIVAVRQGNTAMFDLLLEAGADVNGAAPGDGNPLIWAAANGNQSMVTKLIEAGADVNGAVHGDGNPLIWAAANGNESMVTALIEAGADANGGVTGDGNPLISAARRGNLSMVKLLIEAGADVNGAVPGDGNPLISAARRGNLRMVKSLIEAGADVNGFVLGDETPLINAASANRLDVARYLIEAGAEVNLKVETGNYGKRARFMSPLGQAEINRHTRMIELLRDHGAKS